MRLCITEEAGLRSFGGQVFETLKCTCLLRRAALNLVQREFEMAVDAAQEALELSPRSKNAASLLASAQHKAGKKKLATATLASLCKAFELSDVMAGERAIASTQRSCRPSKQVLHVDLSSS